MQNYKHVSFDFRIWSDDPDEFLRLVCSDCEGQNTFFRQFEEIAGRPSGCFSFARAIQCIETERSKPTSALSWAWQRLATRPHWAYARNQEETVTSVEFPLKQALISKFNKTLQYAGPYRFRRDTCSEGQRNLPLQTNPRIFGEPWIGKLCCLHCLLRGATLFLWSEWDWIWLLAVESRRG